MTQILHIQKIKFGVSRTLNPLRLNAPYFIILLCRTPEDFTRQGESAGAQSVARKTFTVDFI